MPLSIRTALLSIILAAVAIGPTGCSSTTHTQRDSHVGHFRHVVLFKFKDDAPADKVQQVEVAFGKLKQDISSIIDYEWGDTTGSVEKLNDGFTHCFIVTFENVDGLKGDNYIDHPAHKQFVAMLKPVLDKVLVVDFVAQPSF